MPQDLSTLPGIQVAVVHTVEAYREHLQRSEARWAERREFEAAMREETRAWTVAGTCFVCSRDTEFYVDLEHGWVEDGVMRPNWRERMVCPTCGLNGRMRAALHVFVLALRPGGDARIFLAEQTTQVFKILSHLFPGTVGAEYLAPGLPSGCVSGGGIRHEDMQAMSFADGDFDFALSFDVLEHVPDVRRAIGECARILRPGGAMYFTAPVYLANPRSVRRAVLKEGGEVEHMLPPVFHGNPISEDGSLVYTDFGWELVEDLTAAGLDPEVLLVWSDEFGYLGGELPIFVATKG
ncbi:MAG: class I SAM-dependent methyltransferase [Candidatus Sericytochromatia bacterium]|uniref:Class I SAM-dependent methyltransferase n=1 Tax=Candidatus Tanganyikabacteria bacterium TaxID=2961651 RepID=A0A937X3W6_9BACT|nr:class I SAM-dependent methyltransferase [Candidatus Tanganyikabacteria bacterium]